MIEPAAQSSWSARPETLVLAASPALVAALLRFLDGSETTFRDSDLPGFAITLVD